METSAAPRDASVGRWKVVALLSSALWCGLLTGDGRTRGRGLAKSCRTKLVRTTWWLSAGIHKVPG
jgi:hypothetical protein